VLSALPAGLPWQEDFAQQIYQHTVSWTAWKVRATGRKKGGWFTALERMQASHPDQWFFPALRIA